MILIGVLLMDYKPDMKKFFREHNKDWATDKDSIKSWIMKENNFVVANHVLYNFVSAIRYYCFVKKGIFSFRWDLIEKDFGVKFKGE
jgi:hypothetical protein